MAELNCNIEVDFSFEQLDCHWELTRFFRLTWDQADGKNLYYRLGDYSSSILNYKSIDTSKIYTKGNSYIYELPFSVFTSAELVEARDSDGWITLTVYNGSIYKTFKKFYLLELPPIIQEPEAPLKNIRTELVTYNPGEVILSWDKASELDGSDAENSPDSLDGYCIELFHCKEDTEDFIPVKGLKLIKGATEGEENPVYKLIKVNNYSDEIFTEVPEDEENLSFKHSAANVENTEEPLTSEVYLELSKASEDGVNLTIPHFYFTPKELGIMPGDSYKFIIYSYSHYEGALLSTEGTEFINKTPKGIVRVKTENGWIEGQVWVYTEKGWVQAEAIYTKTEQGWAEAQ